MFRSRRLAALLLCAAACLTACANSPTPDASPTALPATREPAAPLTAVSPHTPAPTPVPTPTPAPSPPAPSPPAPSLFALAWDDRTPFAAGLIAAERDVLLDAPGATVYHMQLAISADLTRVNGIQEIRYTNHATETLDSIYFHLYPNLLGGRLTVTESRINGRTVPVPPDDGPQLALPLPAPLPPGEAVVVRLAYETQVPSSDERNYSVFTVQDGVLTLAHFYPMVAVYNHGWDTAVPSTQGDLTFGDASYFLVQVAPPPGQALAASGSRISLPGAADAAGELIAAGPVRDFYLVSSSRFQPSTRQAGEVLLRSWAPAGSEPAAEAVLDFAATALARFGARFGPYPFTELDIIPTPTDALGVEYPGAIAITLRFYDLPPNSGVGERLGLESTTVHEVGHQWFYSLVGNDQQREPWLDEALTQYATYLYYVDTYGPEAAAAFFGVFERNWGATNNAPIPIGQPVAAYAGVEYVSIIYGRGPIFLHELAAAIGQEALDEALRAYVDAHKWGVATGADFQQAVARACACDPGPLFADWVTPDE